MSEIEQREKNKKYQKIYNKLNSEKNKEYQKEYYKKNKQILLNKANEKITCELCQRTVNRCRMNLHKKSSLCKNTQKRNIELKERKEEL